MAPCTCSAARAAWCAASAQATFAADTSRGAVAEPAASAMAAAASRGRADSHPVAAAPLRAGPAPGRGRRAGRERDGRRVEQGPGELQPDRRVGEVMLDRLE